MKYSVDKLLLEDELHKYLFFWGNRASNDGTITKSCFSQWWEQDFKEFGIIYRSAEHYMMAKKAELFNDTEILEAVLACSSPAEAKKLGREVRGYNEDLWLQRRYPIVLQGNYLKFSQNQPLGQFLIKTGNRVLAEASPVDGIWGIGMAADNPDALQPAKWQGLNLLGFALMEVRDMLQDNKMIENR